MVAVLAVELADALGADELDRGVAVVDAGRGQREHAQLLGLGRGQVRAGHVLEPDDLDLEAHRAQPRRPADPGRPAQLGRAALGVLVVGGHDLAHELVAHDVLVAEAHELDALDRGQDVADDDQARLVLARQVDLGDVAGHHHLGAEAQAG